MLIAISGVDGAGKTTQLDLLDAWLRSRGHQVDVMWFRPGYSPMLDRSRAAVRSLLPRALPTSESGGARERAFSRPGVSAAWAGMAVLDSVLHFGARVRASLWRGRTVICDRYVIDGLLDLELRFPDLAGSIRVAMAGVDRIAPTPDLHVMLMLSRELQEQRLADKNEPFPDPIDLRAERHRRYLKLAAGPDVWCVDASGAADELHNQIAQRIEGLAGAHR